MSVTPKYAHAPVVLVVIEIKHPSAAVSAGEAIAVKNALRPVVPFHARRDVATQSVELMMPAGMVRSGTATTTWDFYDSRTRRTRFGVSGEVTTVETSEYDRWQALLEVARAGLAARHQVAPLDGYQRVGLRYINEIRASGEGQPEWKRLIAEPFLPPQPDGGDLVAAQQNCVVQYRTSTPGQTVTVRFGAVDAPAAVAGELRPDPPAPGPYFLLDTDVAWEVPPGEPVPEMDVDAICQTLDNLHRHASSMFEHVLTDQLRRELS